MTNNTTVLKSFSEISLKQYKLPLFVVFKNPKDFKDKYVVRIFDLDQPTEYVVLGDSLQEVNQHIPQGLAFAPRNETDVAAIVGTWF